MEISAKIIAHSIANNIPLITAEWCYPRFIHSEVMTHRMFSRNASSSRAIPIERVLEQVKNSPAMPIHWGKNQPGMQAGEEIQEIEHCKFRWDLSVKDAVYSASKLQEIGLHKQVVNRLLEPFQWIKVLVTATEWDNFFKLRLHPDAQPEIQQLARCMKHAIDNSTPAELEQDDWHLPYIDQLHWESDLKDAIKCSVARCARVSYNNHDASVPNIEKDIKLADMLLAAGHMSPLEHQAAPMPEDKFEKFTTKWVEGVTHYDRMGNYWSGNFRNWLQYRQLL